MSKVMNGILLKSADEIEIMKKGGSIIAKIVRELVEFTVKDIPAVEIDAKAKALCKLNNVTSGTIGYQGYPSYVSVSINDELVHGIPRKGVLIDESDVVKIDMVIIYQNYYLDHAVTKVIGNPRAEEVSRLVNVTNFATNEAIKACIVGNKIGDVSNKMQTIVELAGFNVSRQMIGHGIGRRMHEPPEVPCFGFPNTGPKILPGMTLAIETMAMSGDYELEIDVEDGWTARTIDGSITAHAEHTVAVTKQGPVVLTKE